MWYRQSEQTSLNETVRGLYYDSNFQVCFMAVEVWTNKYLNQTMYDYNDYPANINVVNKSSIAIVAYDKSCKHSQT